MSFLCTKANVVGTFLHIPPHRTLLPLQGFYHELHRPSHFLNFTSMEDVEQAAEADHEDFFQ